MKSYCCAVQHVTN